MVFDHASTLGGRIQATRTINFVKAFQSVAIDPVHDRLYVPLGTLLYIVEGASTINGAPSAAALKTMTPPFNNFTSVAVNPN